MLKSRKSIWVVSIIVVIALVVAGTLFYTEVQNNAGAQQSDKVEEKINVIRIGSTAPGHFKFILSQQKKLLDDEFKKDGIKIEYHTFDGGQSVMTALATGSLDIAYTGTDPAVRTAASGADVNLIGISSFDKNGASYIAVKKDSPIQSVKDLKGKKVAFLTGTMRHATIAKALKAEGLSLNDIQGVNLAFDASGPALIRGDIDAVVEGLSTFAPLLNTGSIRIILDGSKHPEWSTPSAISANGSFVKNHPALVKRLLKVDLATSRWADDNYEEAIKVFAEGTKQTVEAVKLNYPNKKFYQDPKITEEAINAFKSEEDFLKEAKLATGSVDYKKWINSSFVDGSYTEQSKKSTRK
ncbi:aliphatic sulfonate ABC transporter substrate-binding protein [Clostridium sp. WILCCON 0269]|uniref:Aliphatic sulfonate ABC transporter substrate-binding protein n=1 Tax=Candidatus Clostridium eludens TaxID=3381663 RepID=A0ABW8SRF9_9CLOT